MSTIDESCEELAGLISDYRVGEIEPRTKDDVRKWINQFPENRKRILTETLHTLRKTYIGKKTIVKFIRSLLTNENLATKDPKNFWNKTHVLDIQQKGQSQRDMRRMLAGELNSAFGISLDPTPKKATNFIYLDDLMFSGNRVKTDIELWLQSSPSPANVHIIVMAYHSGGKYYAESRIQEKAKQLGKDLTLHWWHILELEDRKAYINTSDVLRPISIGEGRPAIAYEKKLKSEGFPPSFRKVLNPAYDCPYFSSETGRQVLEDAFLEEGANLLTLCPNLPELIRPLGFSKLRTLGSGSLLVTFRNCSNTCPPVLWVDSPWTPLFPRRTT